MEWIQNLLDNSIDSFLLLDTHCHSQQIFGHVFLDLAKFQKQKIVVQTDLELYNTVQLPEGLVTKYYTHLQCQSSNCCEEEVVDLIKTKPQGSCRWELEDGWVGAGCLQKKNYLPCPHLLE
jgi:hypothetical protein